jgi:hypothetical protein
MRVRATQHPDARRLWLSRRQAERLANRHRIDKSTAAQPFFAFIQSVRGAAVHVRFIAIFKRALKTSAQ